MRPARRRSLVPPLGATTGGLRAGTPPAPVRRTGRPSSSSSGRVARSRNVSVAADGAGCCPGADWRAAGCGALASGWAGCGAEARWRCCRYRCRFRGCRSSREGPFATDAAAAAASAARFASASSFSRTACSSARRASSSAALRASASRRRASSAAERIEIVSCSRRSASRLAASRCCSTRARWRAACSVAVRARPAPGAGRPGWATGRGAGAAPAGGGGGAPAAAEGLRARGARFLRTSTCTTFDRPWLKLCRTDPASTVRPSSNRPAGRRESRPLPPS